jgi:hypothetical protein
MRWVSRVRGQHLLSSLDFHFPFFLTTCSNSGVGLIAALVTRLPPLRQPRVSTQTYVRKIVPLGAATTLDIGFSNWSLIYLDVAFRKAASQRRRPARVRVRAPG